MAVLHSASRFEGGEPQAPVSTFFRESGVSTLTAEALVDPSTGMLASSMSLKIKLFPEFVPELITVVVAETFEGIDLKLSIGRQAGRTDDETIYLDWVDGGQVNKWHQKPSATFLEPGGNGDILLNLRIVGDEAPTSGLIYYFIKSRKKWQ